MIDAPELQTMVRTLVANGFDIRNVTHKARCAIVSCARFDEFGGTVEYDLALSDEPLKSSDASAFRRHAETRKAIAILIAPGSDPLEIARLDWYQFLSRSGGAVKSWLPLNADFGAHLIELGHNRAAEGLLGRPDDLFEQYVHAGLQFILADQVIRYGQSRRGEILPDGGGFGRRQPLFLYDAKAYANGYSMSTASLRQFGDYVRRFHEKYEISVGRLAVFVTISGHFADSSKSLIRYSQDLQADCGVPLAYIDADVMAKMVQLLSERPSFRTVLDWRRIFARVIISIEAVRRHLQNVEKDGLIR